MNTEAPKLELDTDSWGTFKLIDLFDIEKVKDQKIKFVNDPFGIPFIGNSIENAGVVNWVSLNPQLVPYKGNCLTISGATSKIVLNGTFREEDFYATNFNISIFRLKRKLMTKNFGHFLSSILKLIGFSKYKGEYNLTTPRLKKETIKLPQTPSGEPDWDFMENYIEQLKEDIPGIPEVQEPTLELDVDSWDEFKIEDLFEILKTKGPSLNSTTEVPNGIPLINASRENEGVCRYIEPTEGFDLYEGNCLTVPDRGSIMQVTYREKDISFMVTHGYIVIFKLKEKELNREIGMFLSIVLRLLANKYSYGYTTNMKRMKAETIKLPTTPEGTPDWDFMERYIKEIEGTTDETT